MEEMNQFHGPPGGRWWSFHISMFLTRVIGGLSGMQEGHFATTRRKILQPRGERFCNHEEKDFATTRRKNLLHHEGAKFIGFQ